MKKLLLLLLTLLCSYFSFASHIVGGELELNRTGPSAYNLKLHLYSDDINGNPAAIDYYATIHMFRKSDNARMEIFTNSYSSSWGIMLRHTSTVPVNYSNIECQDQKLKTSHIIYESDFTLDTARYTDPEGYYFAYERCCRNKTIVNIYEPEASGQTFYMEFPPFSTINSTPRLFPPLSDYACVGTPFIFDFAATDPDNDSLVYTLVTPLRGSSSTVNPAPRAAPAPYRLVDWKPGFSEDYQISGTQTLQIDRHSGLLSLVADNVGLYVFAVKCEEYRNGRKIGEVRREFQLMVLDCPQNEKPALSFINPVTSQPYVPGDTILLSTNESSFDFTVRDPDLKDKLKIEARGTNLTNTQLRLSLSSGMVNSDSNPSDSLNSSLHISTTDPRCQEPFSVRLLVKDNACSVPASDNITIHFRYEAIPNRAPVLSANNPADTIELIIYKDSIQFEVSGVDPDNDLVQIKAEVDGNDPSQYGMNFQGAEAKGEVKSLFSWKPGCESIGVDGHLVHFILNDVACQPDNFDTLSVYLRLKYQNLAPALKVNNPSDTMLVAINKHPVSFEVSGLDPDAHTVQIRAKVNGQDPAAFGMNFPPLEAMAEAKGMFQWQPGCNALAPGEYTIHFIINDVMCTPDNFDTTTVVIKVMEDNAPASMYLSDSIEVPQDKAIKVQLGTKIQFQVFGEDADPSNRLALTAQGIGFGLSSVGMSFPDTEGNSLIASTFLWNSSCEHQDFLNKPLQVAFTLSEQVCDTTYSETMVINFELIDTVAKDQVPYNVITPNGDGKNEYFSLEGVTLQTCIGNFEFVEVYNRWGDIVFKDTVKEFKWEAEKFSPGVYYYYIKFQHQDFKGWVSVLK